MSARRTPEYEEELGCPKEENEPDRQLLDAAFNLQHRTVLRGADITEDLRTEWQEPKPPHIKEEEEPILIKKEEEEEDITKFPQTGVPLKGEDEGQSEESRGAEPPSSSSTHHMRTEAERDHCGGSQADGLLAPLSDSDDMSHPPHTDENHHDKQSESAIICHTDNKRWKCSQCGKTFAYISSLKQHVRIHTGEKPFACSVCSKRFTQKGYLKKHTKSHIATHLPPINPHHHLHLSLLVPGNPRQSIAAYPSGTTAHQTHVSYPIPCSLVNSCLLVPSVPDSRHSCQPPVLSTACHLFIILHQSPPALGFSYFPHLTHMMLF
ncbi:tissue-resident T-cell transcription regulator protein ZNF683-like isoform X5 [Phycodurus eques]|uniref:tissue-resident T-cell transcription regulator protein ZNF683-like isoform X5 n=1 Tax=Phycodurus eques TaxID=693459 RepID=UPI002ACECD15|nr:tissue-resident T-cell transcription regulator protein ZNF683-like isoform X5 [Phycodurus eques]